MSPLHEVDQVTAAREALATLKPQAAMAVQQPVAPVAPVQQPVTPTQPEPMDVEAQLTPIGIIVEGRHPLRRGVYI